jgi:hypothetical protein
MPPKKLEKINVTHEETKENSRIQEFCLLTKKITPMGKHVAVNIVASVL